MKAKSLRKKVIDYMNAVLLGYAMCNVQKVSGGSLVHAQDLMIHSLYPLFPSLLGINVVTPINKIIPT